MNDRQQRSACSVIPFTSANQARTVRAASELAHICSAPSINLAGLAEFVRGNRNLCYVVTEAACQEFGWTWLSVEDSIVLLGAHRLLELLSHSNPRGRSASQFRRNRHTNCFTPSTKPCLLEIFQGEPK
jgi:hypothetical protein